MRKFKLGYSPLGEALSNEVKSKTDTRNKVVNINKQEKNLFYNSQHSFVKFKDISDFKELSVDSMQKSWMVFIKKVTRFKNLISQTKGNKNLKEKALGNAGDLFNQLY